MATPKDQPAAPTNRELPTRPDNPPAAVYYRPREGVHLLKAGDVALGNWAGKVGGQTHWVYYGAPKSEVPEAVRAAMLKSRIGFGKVTPADFGPVPVDRTLPLPGQQPEV
jgi:hypothetical protein